ncbi:MAG: aminopeptidase P family N-terminal domain-containing protein, partial [Actinomycetota bacterium]
MFATRLDRARARMEADGVDVLMLSVGSDLPYFCGYEAMPLERITMLVVPREGEATLVIPALEQARVHERPEIFSIAPWGETEDPIAKIASLAGAADTVAIG